MKKSDFNGSYKDILRCTRFTVTPLNYEVEIKALSNEKLSLRIPASLTIGPNIDEPEELHKYVTLLVSDGSEEHQERLIR
jgi:flotillin